MLKAITQGALWKEWKTIPSISTQIIEPKKKEEKKRYISLNHHWALNKYLILGRYKIIYSLFGV
jgi:hypothetical protein